MSDKPDITARLRHRLIRVHVPGEPFCTQDVPDPDAVEAAEEIERLRRQNEELLSHLNGISRQAAAMVAANK